jgi:hypothetical protein
MARNRKYRSAAIRFGPALKAFLLCLLIGGAGVGYVWQKEQINRLGRQIKQRELRLEELVELNEKQRRQLATLRSPQVLELRIRELKLDLAPPSPLQVWRLPNRRRNGRSRARAKNWPPPAASADRAVNWIFAARSRCGRVRNRSLAADGKDEANEKTTLTMILPPPVESSDEEPGPRAAGEFSGLGPMAKQLQFRRLLLAVVAMVLGFAVFGVSLGAVAGASP